MANNKDQSPPGDGASNDRNYRADGSLDFDDDEVMSGGGNHARTGGTWAAQGADSGKLAPPREILSDRNGPSDPDNSQGDGTKRPS